MTNEQKLNVSIGGESVERLVSWNQLRPNKVLLFMEGDGTSLCPFCRGTGKKLTAITTLMEQCQSCNCEGRVYSR